MNKDSTCLIYLQNLTQKSIIYLPILIESAKQHSKSHLLKQDCDCCQLFTEPSLNNANVLPQITEVSVFCCLQVFISTLSNKITTQYWLQLLFFLLHLSHYSIKFSILFIINCQSQIQMQRNKGKISNSASLGKTVARGQTIHSKSFFIQPSDFDQSSIRNNISIQQKRYLPNSTPKLSSKKGVPSKTIGITNSISLIHQNRKNCEKLNSDLHTSIIQKSIKVNKLYRELHHFSICMQEVKWLLTQGDKLIAQYLKTIKFVSPQSTHTLDITEIAREFRSLVLRFANIDKNRCKSIEDFIKNQCSKEVDRLNFSSLEEFKSNPERREATQTQQNTLILQKEKQTKQNSIMDFRNFSYPMKENVNNSNFATHFDNINLDQPVKPKIERSTNGFKTFANDTINVSKLVKQRQQWERQKQHLYEDISQQHKKVEELMGTIELLKSQIFNKESKMCKYKTTSTKSIEQLSQILKRLMLDLNSREKQFQLLKMAQCINRWEKINDQEEQETIYQSIKGDKAAYEIQHKQKLQEIISLQYQINSLLAQRKFLQAQQYCSKNSQKNQQNIEEEYYKMLSIQALTIQQLCSS